MAQENFFDQYDSPVAGRRERKEEAQIGSSEAGAASSRASAAKTTALTPGEVELQQLQIEEARRKQAEADAAAEAAKGAQAGTDQDRRQQMLGFLEDIQRVRDLLSNPMATGPAAQLTGGIYGSPAKNLNALITALKSPIVLKAMQAARQGSKAGATGFGALQNKELELLASAQGSLDVGQSPEQLLPVLNRLEESARRSMAYAAGYDPNKPEGAALVGLPAPQGTEEPAEPTGGDMTGGEWTKNPELRGVDASILSMVKAGRSPAQIRQWLNEYQPGLGDKAQNIEANVDYWRKTGKEPNVTIERQFVPKKNLITSTVGSGPAAAYFTNAADQLTAGLLDEMSGDRQRTAAVRRGLSEENPVSGTLGSVSGGLLASLIPEGLAAKYGMRLPSLLQGLPQATIYGGGSAEPGERMSGAFYEGLATPVTNLVGNVFGKAIGVPLQGADEGLRRLADRYGINLTPGQMTGGGGAERTLAGAPIVGSQVRARRNETLEQFNKAAFDEGLAPIGAKVSAPGQKGIAEAQAAVSDAYTNALGGVNMQLDPTFAQQFRGKAYSELGGLREIGPELQKEVDDIFLKYADPANGTLTGEGMQNALQELQGLKSAYSSDPRWAKRIKPQLDEISDAYSGLLERQHPENYKLFQDANDAYRNVSILERAVDYGAEGDIFNPANLRSATRQGTVRFGGKKASARGDRPFNELVMPALDVIPSKLDEASLAGRLGGPAVLGGAGLGYGGISMMAQPDRPETGNESQTPGILPAPLAYGLMGVGLGALPYSRLGTRGMTAALRGSRTPQQRTLGELIENYLPAALRGGYRGATAEPGVPMPQEPTSNIDAKTQELINQMQFAPTPEPTAAPVELAPGEMLDKETGRMMAFNPETQRWFYTDNGEDAEHFAHGGRVHRGLAYAVGR